MTDGQGPQESEAARVLAETNPEDAKAMRGQAQAAAQAGAKFQATREQTEVLPMEGAETLRAFAAPHHPYGRILIREGTPVAFPDKDSPMGERLISRKGDVHAIFKNGVCLADLTTEEGRMVAEWCDAHGADKELHKQYHRAQGKDAAACRTKPGFCRDVTDPLVGIWSQFKTLQTATASRDPAVSPTQDIDAGLAGTGGGRAMGPGGQAIESGRRMVKAREDG